MAALQPVEQQSLFGDDVDDLTLVKPPAEPRVQRGDLWALDDHLLLCGDATNEADVSRLLSAAPESPFLMVTDPPYGAGFDKTMARYIREQDFRPKKLRRKGKILNDDIANWGGAFVLSPAPVAYVWHSGIKCAAAYSSMEDAGYTLREQIVWVKNIFSLSWAEYHWRHELCVYAVRNSDLGKGGVFWQGGRGQDTVWSIPAIQAQNAPTHDYYGSSHPTQKPVECFARPLRNHDAPVVLDMFVGSGTIYIAAERVGRVALGIEIMPEYCDMALARWEAYTGTRARLLETKEYLSGGKR